MKDKVLLLFIVLSMSFSVYADEGANQDTTRALIVARLLSQISWQNEDFVQKSDQSYKLCSYKSYPAYRNFTNNLKKLSINNLPVKIVNVVKKNDISNCHAVYLKASVLEELDWFLANNQSNRAVLVVEGSFLGAKSTSKGGHINLSLNTQGYFDFELNPDIFIESEHSPSLGLLKLGKMLSSKAAEEAQLMRNLINYTEWPNDDLSINSADYFQLCAYTTNPFISFAEFFLDAKSLKGKKITFKQLADDDKIDNCHAFFLGNSELVQSRPLLLNRSQSNILLIGNSPAQGKSGSHYNLQPAKMLKGRRFEINLFAFKLTGHLPKYELLNSAVVVETDYPSLAEELARVIELTQWPESLNIDRPVNLCLAQENNQESGFLPFLIEYFAEIRSLSDSTFSVSSPKLVNQCDAIFVAEDLTAEMSHFIKKQNYHEILLVTSRSKKNDTNPYHQWQHYSLLLSPNSILLELSLKNMRVSGFTAKAELIESAVLIGGEPQ